MRISSGYIYIIKCGPFYKIGYAKNPLKRIKRMQQENPYELKFIFSELTLKPIQIETKIHRKFAKYHYRGEWHKFDKQTLKKTIQFIHKLIN